jgi:hypothetical protein
MESPIFSLNVNLFMHSVFDIFKFDIWTFRFGLTGASFGTGPYLPASIDIAVQDSQAANLRASLDHNTLRLRKKYAFLLVYIRFGHCTRLTAFDASDLFTLQLRSCSSHFSFTTNDSDLRIVIRIPELMIQIECRHLLSIR